MKAPRPEPRVCTFDNPMAWRRECWSSGRLLYSYAAEVLPGIARQPIPARYFFFGANVGRWTPGRCIGDSRAMLP